MQPVKIKEVDDPVAIFTALTQAEFSENVVFRGIMYVRPSVPIIRYDKHIP